jgi:hypothetical protein
MKTAIQELFSQLETEHPNLLNINTMEGRKFVNDYYKFFEMEKEQIKDAYQQGFNNAYFSNPLNKEQYYKETFKD